MDAYRALYRRAAEKPEEFWGDLAEKELFWFQKWSHVFEWHPPFAKWFVGGKTNASYNCVDRHLTTHRKNKVAILWEGEPGNQRGYLLPGVAPAGVPLRQRAEGARAEEGRPRHHLYRGMVRAGRSAASLRAAGGDP